MKKTIGIFLFLLTAGFSTSAYAANLYWVGNDGANTSVATNWKTTDPSACGSGDASAVPTTTDIAIFDADCDNGATIDAALSVGGVDIKSGYTGTITQGSGITINTDSSGWVQAGGTFSGSNAAITLGNISVTASMTLSGGTFTSTSGSLTIYGGFSNTGATFTHNSGTVLPGRTGNWAVGTGTGKKFYNFSLTIAGSPTVTLTDHLEVENTLTMTGTTGSFATTPTLRGDTNDKNVTVKNLTISGGSTKYTSGAAVTTVTGTYSNSLNNTDWTTDGGTLIIRSDTSQTLPTDTYKHLELDDNGGAATTYTLGAATTVSGNLTIDAGATLDTSNGNNFGISLAGNWSNSGAFTERSGTVTFNGSAAQTLTGETFYNLTINNTHSAPDDSNDVDSSAAVTVTNTLTVTDGQFQPTTASSFKDVSIGAAGILKPDSGATITVSGNWANSGTFTPNSGTVQFTSSSTQTLNSGGTTSAFAFYDIIFSGSGTLQPVTSDIQVNNNLTFNAGAGTFDDATNDKNITVTGNVTMDNTRTDLGDGTWTVGGNWDDYDVTTFNRNSSTLVMNGTSKTLNHSSTFANALNNLTVDGTISLASTGNATYLNGGVVTVNSNKTLTINTPQSLALYNKVTSGLVINSSGTVTGTGAIYMQSSTVSQQSGTLNVASLEIRGAGGADSLTLAAGTYASATVLIGAESNTPNFTFSSGTTTFTGNVTLYNNNGSSTLTIPNNTTNPNLVFQGNVTWTENPSAISWTKGNGTITLSGGSGTNTVDFDGESVEAITVNAAGVIKQLADNVTTAGLTVTAGTLSLNGKNLLRASSGAFSNDGTITLNGNETMTNFTGDTDSGQVTYQGAVTATIPSISPYYNVTFNNASGTWTLPADTDINGNLTITAGTLDADSSNNRQVNLAGNWSNSGTFNERQGKVVFDGTSAQTLNGETFYNLEINNGYTTPDDSNDVDSSAAVTVSGTLTVTDGQFQPTTGSSFKNVTIATNGVLKPDASASLTVTGNWSNSGTFTHNSGTVTITSTSNLAGGTGSSKRFYNLTVSTSSADFTATLTDDLDVANTLSLSGNSSSYSCGCDETCYNYYYVTLNTYSNNKNVTTTNLTVGSYSYYTSGTGTTTVNGTYTRSGTTDWTTYDGTLKMVSNTSQDVPADTYHHLELDDNGGGATTYTLSSATAVQGNLTIDAGATLDTKNGSSYGLTISGNWSNSGTFTARNGTVTFDGSSGSNTINPGSSSFYRLTFNNSSGVWDLTANAVTVTNWLTITSGIFDLNGQSITATGAVFTNSSTLRLQGSETVTGLNVSTSSGTVVYDGSGAYASGLAAGDNYFHLTFNGSGTWTLDANLDVNGNLTLTQGTLDAKSGSNYQINIARAYSNTAGTFNEQQGKVVFDGTTGQGLTGETFYDLEINNSATPDDSTDVDSSAAVTVTGTLTVTDGQFQPTTASSFNHVTISTNGVLKPDASASISVSGNWSNTGTFTANSGAVVFNGTAAQTLTGETFYDLTINNTYAAPDDTFDVDSSAAVTVSNTLTVTDGQFQPTTASSFKDITIAAAGILKPDSTAAISVSGNWTNSGTFTANLGTVTFNGTSSGTLITGGAGASYDFYNLTLNKTSSTDANDNLALSTNNLVVTGTLTVTDGEFLQSGDVDITVPTVSVASAGKWNITGGTANDKVVVTIGSGGVTNAGTISFNGLAGGTGGGDADVIQIRSSTSGTQRTWISSGSPTFTMVDVDVKDQTTSPTTLTIDVLSGTDSGNNTRWFFDDKIDHFVVTTAQPTTLSIGSSLSITITAKNHLNGVVTSGYSGDKTLTFSGPAVTSSGQYATASDKINAAVNFGTATTVNFTCGSSSCTATSTLTLYKAESVSIDVSDGTYSTTGSADYDLDLVVTATSAVALKFTTEPAPLETTVLTVFTTQPVVAVVDSYGNTVTDDSASEITLTAVLASDSTTVAPGTLATDTNPVTVTSGVATFSGVSYNQSGIIKLKATSGSLTAVLSAEIKVSATQASIYLTDVNGQEKLGYNIGEAVYVKVVDEDENTDSASKQTVQVTITNQSSGDNEQVTLEETDNDTGIFTNKDGTTPPHAPLPSSVRSTGIPDDFVLEIAASGGSIVAQYTDDDTPEDTASDTASFGSVSFNVIASVSGPVKAGESFNLIVTAMSGAGGTGNPLVNYQGTALLEVGYISPSAGTKTISPSSVSGFSAGSASVSIQYEDAGKIKIKAVDSADSGMTGESQEIVMIPASFSISLPVAPLTVGGDFDMTVTAKSVSGGVTPNYSGTVNLTAAGEEGTTGTLQVTSGNSFSNGILNLTNRYASWGKIYITAADSVYSNVTGDSQLIDFIPKKLDVILTPPPGSRSAAGLYTYYTGETFHVTVKALGFNDQVISNYGGSITIKADSELKMPESHQFSASDQGSYDFEVLAANDHPAFTVEAVDSAWPQVTGTSSPPAEIVTAMVKVESAYGTTGQPVEVKVRLVDSAGRTITSDSTTVVHLIFYVDGKKLLEDSLLPTVTLPETKELTFTNGAASFTVSSSEIKTITVLAHPGMGSVVQESLPGTINIGSIGGRNVRILTWNEVRTPESPAQVSNRKGLVLQ